MSGQRRDVWQLGAGWNDDLLWYAKAVAALQDKPITDRTSWRYLAAMHQFKKDKWVELGLIEDDTPLPDADINVAWSQCQHASFYFLPWHRGYLARFEDIIAATIVSLGGPAGWKLPYWNYLDDTNPKARHVPDAFLEKYLPGGTDLNPLNNLPRYGQTVIGPEPLLNIDDITLNAMQEPDFTGSVSFGGSVTGFSNAGSGDPGQLEIDPHGSVHVLVGGYPPANAGIGYLSRFYTAGLDPIFWLHHCNLDRLWQAWMSQSGVTMESGKKWLDGPTPRHFALPLVDGSGLETFSARDTLEGGKYFPDYDDLTKGTGVTPGAGGATGIGQGALVMAEPEVIGANSDRLAIGTQPVDTALSIAPAARTAVVAAMGPAGPAEAAPTRLFLKLENVRGVSEAGGIKVFVNLPSGVDADAGAPDYVAGSAALFGLASATDVDGQHGGNGLTLTFDISALAQRLVAADDFDPAHLRIKVVAAHDGGDGEPITIDRVSVLRG